MKFEVLLQKEKNKLDSQASLMHLLLKETLGTGDRTQHWLTTKAG